MKRPPELAGSGRLGVSGWAKVAAIVAVSLGGWTWGAWEHFVAAPLTRDVVRITYTLDLIDRFDDTEGHRAYVQLASDMKPWWDQIEDLQRRIQAAPGDDAREALIAERDASLVAFIRDKGLAPRIDLLIGAFDDFVRCLDTSVCDQDVIDKAIGIDVKRIYRTFRPYLLARRAAGGEAANYGKNLEDLFFRLLG
ncbi:MAG: hypothetical protein OEL76_14225 [Siculibacillus sp.]|nr:hypothetical protein [Siculibacillus sp.]